MVQRSLPANHILEGYMSCQGRRGTAGIKATRNRHVGRVRGGGEKKPTESDVGNQALSPSRKIGHRYQKPLVATIQARSPTHVARHPVLDQKRLRDGKEIVGLAPGHRNQNAH